MKGADLDSIEVSKAGFVVGDPSGNPNVIIGLGSDDTIGITGINYCFYKKTQAAREQR